MNKKLITLLTVSSAISLGAHAETTVVEHYCGKDGVKFREAVKVDGAQRVYIGFGGKTQVLAKTKQVESEKLIEGINKKFETTEGCNDFLIHRYKEAPRSRVTFNFNKSQLTSSAKFVLDGYRTKKLTYNIIGNTDSIGTESYNLQLGGERAHEVAQYLEDKGLGYYNSAHIISLGEMNPIALNTTAKGRSLNRRVDITLSD